MKEVTVKEEKKILTIKTEDRSSSEDEHSEGDSINGSTQTTHTEDEELEVDEDMMTDRENVGISKHPDDVEIPMKMKDEPRFSDVHFPSQEDEKSDQPDKPTFDLFLTN